MKTMNNGLSKSSIRSSRKIANDLSKFASKVVKQVNRMSESNRLSAMQIIANMDDAASFDAAVAARTTTNLASQIVYVLGTEVATDLDKIIASFVNDERRAKAVMKSAIRGGRFSNVHLSYAVVR